jgi:subtilisin-like proprotein convertase family protein
MRLWLLALPFALPMAALADDKRCLISFDSATLDVCTGRVATAHDALLPLADVAAHQGSPLRIVKFGAPVGLAQHQALERAGATILGYAPHHAYLVRMPAQLDAAVRAIDGVLWSGPFLPIWKIDVNLARDIGRADKDAAGESIIEQAGIDSLSIALHPGADGAGTRNALLATPGIELRRIEQAPGHERLVLGFDRDLLASSVATLAAHPEVASVSMRWNNEFMNSQAGWLHQSGTNTGAGQLPVFEQGIFGCGQIVGAADSGLFATNCAFSDTEYGQPVTSVCNTGSTCPTVSPDFDHRKIGAHYKWDGSTGAPADGHGHGTHVMGSILGNNPASAVDCENYTSPGGLTDLDGTAPGAKLISQEMGPGLQYLNSLGGTIYHAAVTAYNNGARVHNNSWGSSCRNSIGQCIAACQVEYRQTTRDADAAVWEFPELALLVAAGNSGGLGGNAGCGPGADVGAAGNAKNVFSIGSNNRGTGGNAMSGFSSRGPTQDRRSKPDLAAQGASIVSAQRNACGTRVSSGTSMATPTAAGLAALVREYLVRGFYPTGVETAANALTTPSGALVKAIMINGAQEITGTGTTGGAPSQSQGWGRVHLDNALYFQGDDSRLWLHDGTAGLQTGAVVQHDLAVAAGEPLVVTLVWHDAPAAVNANPHAVNRLRLEVQTPNGEVWTQKLPAGGGLASPNPLQSTTTSDYDDVNNVHQIRFDAPVAGAYQVRVRGIQVALGPQPYALAANGDVAAVTGAGFGLQATPTSVAICAGTPAVFNLGVTALDGFDDPVTLGVTGLPGSSSAAFSVNPVVPAMPAAASSLTIGSTSGVATGDYTLDIQGDANGPGFPASSQSVEVTLSVTAAAPPAATLIAPADGAVDLALLPQFSWTPLAGATGYRLEVATDAQFDDVVIDQSVAVASFTPASALAAGTAYWWRVTAENACGDGAVSASFSFTTSDLLCSTPNLAIPDNNPTGVTDVLAVADSGTVQALRLAVDLDHTYVGDLRLTLSKDGTDVLVVDRPGANGCSGNDMDVLLDDDASETIQDDCASGANPAQAYIAGASYQPANALAGFAGADLAGNWTLTVSDLANADLGTLAEWCLLPVIDGGGADSIFSNGFECAPGLPGCSEPVTLVEGFEDIGTLVGAGWILQNNSQPLGTTSWQQGDSTTMPSQAGGVDSYISANFNNAAGVGTISNWLVSPLLSFDDASSVAFWTRAAGTGNFPDRLEIRACSGASCSNVGTAAGDTGDFGILMKSINPDLEIGDDPTGENGYPYAAWAQFELDQADGLPTSGQGRIAFRYYVTNSGPDGSNGSFIGIDSVTIQAAGIDGGDGGNLRGISTGSIPAVR